MRTSCAPGYLGISTRTQGYLMGGKNYTGKDVLVKSRYRDQAINAN